MLKEFNPHLVFFMETKLCKDKMKKVHNWLGFLYGFDVSTDGTKGDLSLALKGNVSISLQSFSDHQIDVEVEDQ